MEINVKVLDPSTNEVLASNSVTAEVGAPAAGTLALEKNVKGTSATVYTTDQIT